MDEVGTILDGVKQLIKGQVTEEMEKLAQQSVLYLRQVFLQAEGNGVAINVDLSQLDDASVTQHTHEHSHCHDSSHSHVRGFTDIRDMLQASELPEPVKQQSIAVFRALGEAEALTHGSSLESVHFHEVGAIDRYMPSSYQT